MDVIQTNSRKTCRTQNTVGQAIWEVLISPPIENHENVQVHPNRTDGVTHIATNLSTKLKQGFNACLSCKHDVFAWLSKDVMGVPLTVMVHKLDTLPEV